MGARKLGQASWGRRSGFRSATENRMQAYALTFAGCAVCTVILFVYDVTPNVLKVGKVAAAIFTALFIGAEILALLR
jgi:hypothetical protein